MASAKKVNTVKKKQGLFTNLYRYREYYIMLIPGILFFLVFCYGPMYDCISGLLTIKGNLRKRICRFEAFQSAFQQPVLLIRIEKYADHQHI